MTTQTMREKLVSALYCELSRQADANLGYVNDLRGADGGLTILDGAFDLDAAMRAALQALREPTEEMERAAFDVLEVSPSPLFATGTLARNAVYTAMIDAALQEKA